MLGVHTQVGKATAEVLKGEDGGDALSEVLGKAVSSGLPGQWMY